MALQNSRSFGRNILCCRRSVELCHCEPFKHRCWSMDGVERLRALPLRSAVLLPVHRVCKRGGSPRRQTQTLAESPLLLWDGLVPRLLEFHLHHFIWKRHRLRHGSSVRPRVVGQKGRRRDVRPAAAPETGRRREDDGNDKRSPGVNLASSSSSSDCPPPPTSSSVTRYFESRRYRTLLFPLNRCIPAD